MISTGNLLSQSNPASPKVHRPAIQIPDYPCSFNPGKIGFPQFFGLPKFSVISKENQIIGFEKKPEFFIKHARNAPLLIPVF